MALLVRPPETVFSTTRCLSPNTADCGITYSYEEDKQSWWKYRIQGDVPPWMYYVKFEGMSEEEARAMVEEAQPKEPTLFGGEE